MVSGTEFVVPIGRSEPAKVYGNTEGRCFGFSKGTQRVYRSGRLASAITVMVEGVAGR